MLLEECKATVEANVITYSSFISSYSKADEWQSAMVMLREMREAHSEPNQFSYSPVIAALPSSMWENALALLKYLSTQSGKAGATGQSAFTRLRQDEIRMSLFIAACEKGWQWERALGLLTDVL